MPWLIGFGGILAGCAAVALAAVMKGAVGFGFPLIAVPLLAAIVGARTAVLVVAIPALLANVLILRSCGRHALQPWFLRMAVAVAVGAVGGALLFRHLPVRALTLGLGVIALGLLAALGRRAPDSAGGGRLRGWAPLVGLAAGVLGGATDISGPVLVAYLTAIERDRDRFLYVLVTLYVILGGAQLATLARAGLYALPVLLAAAAACLPMVAGVAVGARIRARLTNDRFRHLVLAVVVVSALNLVRQGIWG